MCIRDSYSRQNMVSGQQLEFTIPPLSAIPTFVWDLKQFNINKNEDFWSFFLKLKPLEGIPYHNHLLSGPEWEWGWLVREHHLTKWACFSFTHRLSLSCEAHQHRWCWQAGRLIGIKSCAVFSSPLCCEHHSCETPVTQAFLYCLL